MNAAATRIGIALRVLAAAAGGYGLAALWAMGFAVALPMPHQEAALGGMLLGFPVHAGAAIWVFAARSMAGAITGLVAAAIPPAFAIFRAAS